MIRNSRCFPSVLNSSAPIIVAVFLLCALQMRRCIWRRRSRSAAPIFRRRCVRRCGQRLSARYRGLRRRRRSCSVCSAMRCRRRLIRSIRRGRRGSRQHGGGPSTVRSFAAGSAGSKRRSPGRSRSRRRAECARCTRTGIVQNCARRRVSDRMPMRVRWGLASASESSGTISIFNGHAGGFRWFGPHDVPSPRSASTMLS